MVSMIWFAAPPLTLNAAVATLVIVAFVFVVKIVVAFTFSVPATFWMYVVVGSSVRVVLPVVSMIWFAAPPVTVNPSLAVIRPDAFIIP